MRATRPGALWVIIDGNVYDLTAFAPEHPGARALTARGVAGAGRPTSDAQFAAGVTCYRGKVDASTVPQHARSGAAKPASAAAAGAEPGELP
eukprot:gene5825-13181_t